MQKHHDFYTLREVKPLVNENNEQATVENEEVSTEETEETTEKVEEVVSAEQQKISELEAKLEESENRLLRLQADFDNYRRRVRLDQDAAQKYRAQNLVTDILPALDNFERALKVESEDEKIKTFLQGMEMVHRQLVEALKSEGLESIEAVGQSFDPHLHQAVMQVEEGEAESNTVLEEFQKGYKLKDRIIRPSMVKVKQ
ncbi:nucleotide exchange factor GrpE [Bacillus sp. CHD6a]|uniref:nucleotide exchange factor GrpE n=1 Tax=Bacillus sp. CHD6a TaxID=1643452 RepID=UPI0006CD1E7E|nr:nucleotide exchange factor GrpE [Bacillus sp. CHD6a]KPB05160.1 heat shock protein GrpE [Bacillus sp. CHD6a]